jgi:hypothetical protein
MALARRKFWFWRRTVFLLLPTLGLLAAIGPLRASVSERVVSDRHTGLAIFGFDPVAYFTDAKPLAGRPEYEVQLSDSIWRFRSEGNRAAFMANPEIYRPRYGGHDPMALGRGIALAGNPLVWLVVGERLYFFYTPQAREAFALDPETAISAAEQHWPAVIHNLAQ